MKPIPTEALEALEAALRGHQSAVLRVDRPPKANLGPPQWRVIVNEVVVAASQPHLVGGR